jgi:Protein of unknown function (DUF4058)
MPSPFPGMDPYIESSGVWGDFHGSLLSAIRADLNSRLPSGYSASLELYVWAEEGNSEKVKRAREPDVFVREDPYSGIRLSATATIVAPSTIVLPELKRKKRRYLRVVDNRTRQVVTVVELLSPTNKKPGDDRVHYLEKRNEYFANNLNFVEIDLLRSGRRPPLGKSSPGRGDFYVMVCRAWEYPSAGFWSFGLRETLPDLPIPVTEELGDTPLHLQACFERAYDEGRYQTSLSYDEPLKPKPNSEDQRWIADIVASRATPTQRK